MHKTFLGCDWGTSSLRLWLIDIGSGNILAASSSVHEGIAAVHELWKQSGLAEKQRIHFYVSVLQKHIKKIEADAAINTAGIPVIISGMASATIGIIELPYTELPVSLTGRELQYKKIEKTNDFLHDLVIISGARTNTDVMRGEETQLIGCFTGESVAEQTFIFTGTHSKHIATRLNAAVSLSTFMTGEFFELLTVKSILSASVAAGGSIENNEGRQAFEQGVADSLRQNLLHDSFMVRTNQLFKLFSPTANYYYLSGLLIGAELNQVSKNKDLAITIVGEQKLVSLYRFALKVLGIVSPVTVTDAATACIQGQRIMYQLLYE